MNETKEQVIVITGASAGVGRATAVAFARKGVQLALIARQRERLLSAKKEVEERGAEALIFPADVADGNTLERIADEVESQFGPIDIWINNAMVSVFSPVKEMLADEYRRVTEVTYLGTVYGTLAALKRMLPRDHGTIVQVGSALSYRSIPLQSAYCAAKHAVQGFTESLRSELIHDGSHVRITMVQLPALNTPQFDWEKSRLPRKSRPVPPIYQPEVAARAIVWAAEHDRRELNVGLSTSLVLFLNKFFPGIGDYYLARTGFESQMSSETRDPNAPDNLWNPVQGDYGAHGRFDDRAASRSPQLWLNTHRVFALAALTLLGFIGFRIGFRRL
jgi:short-subunit dehydrogenase